MGEEGEVEVREEREEREEEEEIRIDLKELE